MLAREARRGMTDAGRQRAHAERFGHIVTGPGTSSSYFNML
jgi:hypothetical protein